MLVTAIMEMGVPAVPPKLSLGGTTMSNNKQTVRDLLQAIADRDRATLERIVSEDASWWAPVSSGLDQPLKGRPSVVDLLSGTQGYFRPNTTTWTVIALIEEGQTIVAHVRRQCITSSDQPYDNTYLLRFDFAGPHIVEAWEHTDTTYAASVLRPSAA
jgi:ketosteroid isomerase-like protein